MTLVGFTQVLENSVEILNILTQQVELTQVQNYRRRGHDEMITTQRSNGGHEKICVMMMQLNEILVRSHLSTGAERFHVVTKR